MNQSSLDQLMELIKARKEKRNALEEAAATQVTGQPWRTPREGQNTLEYMMGRGNSPAESRALNQLYGSILNRKPGQTAIGAASGGLELGSQLIDNIREKQKASKMASAKMGVEGAQQDIQDQVSVMNMEQKNLENDRWNKEFERLSQFTLSPGQTRFDRNGNPIASGGEKPLTPKEASDKADTLSSLQTTMESVTKASKFLSALDSGASTGAFEAALQWFPGRFTNNSKFLEELDAFAEQAARAKLKAVGEIRPTDADVEGMKNALFGIGKDERVNKNLLTEYIREQMAVLNADRAKMGLPPLQPPKTGKVEQGKNWFDELFVKPNANSRKKQAPTIQLSTPEAQAAFEKYANE